MLSEEEILSSYPWLTKDLFTEIIQEDHKDDSINITDFIAKAALAPGENYTSTMIRASVHYDVGGEIGEKRFIVKAGHNKTEVRQAINELNFFEKEITMYRDILPKVEKMLADVGDHTKLSAKCYKISDNEDEPYLVFEDLSFRGYKNVNRRLGLDMSHFKKTLYNIARWHAATTVLLETNNYKDFPRLLDFVCLQKTNQIKQMTKTTVKAASELTQSMPGYEHLSEKLFAAIPTIFSKIDEPVDREEGSFFTLCHGDLWMNNILFAYDEHDKVADAILVDYQAPFRGAAIMDIVYCLYSSSAEGLEEREWDILIQYYHNERTKVLKLLGYDKPIPSLTSTQREFLEKGHMFTGPGLIFPGARALENDGEDLMTFFGEDETSYKMNLKMISNPKCRKTMEFILNFFDKKGYFD